VTSNWSTLSRITVAKYKTTVASIALKNESWRDVIRLSGSELSSMGQEICALVLLMQWRLKEQKCRRGADTGG
jgi:hypothetical protein